MSFKSLTSLFEDDKNFHILKQEISKEKARFQVVSPRPLHPFLITGLFRYLTKTIFVITDNLEKAQRLAKDVRIFSPNEVFFLPDWEILPHERVSPGKEIISERLRILYYLRTAKPIIAISAVQTIMRRIPVKESPLLEPIYLKIKEKFDPYVLFEKLTLMGYERAYKVEARGQFSARGGIIDIFAAHSEVPIRVELFGDEIESLRTFSISTQRSTDEIEDFEVFSCREVYLDSSTAKKVIEILKSYSEKKEIQDDIERLEKQQYFDGIERYTPFLYKNLATVLDFISQDTIVIFEDESRVKEEADRFFEQQKNYLSEAILNGEIVPPPTSYFLSFEEIKIDKRRINFSTEKLSAAGENYLEPHAIRDWVEFESEPIQPILGKLERLRKFILQLMEDKFFVVILVNDQGQAERLNEILSEWGINVKLIVGDLSQGFILATKKFALLSHSDIFLKSYKERRFESYVTEAQPPTYPIKSFADLRRGDYVVHVSHGIAIYDGIVTKEIRGVVRDYMVLNYAEGDKLYVPIDQADRVSKYIGTDSKSPKVYRLTGNEWLRVKRRVKKSAKNLAIDIYNLYSERAKTRGFAFSTDTVWQAELEEAFSYEETRGQLEATADVKQDMEQPRPMDRLVCGDVGYGKTEVTMRAAFKAVMDEKQVMVLVPTTILAEQHFKTFESRFSPYPVIIEGLSRFKSLKEQKEVVKRFREGKIDVLIGTHRLLQRDVQPKKLGLLVVDEEQRFGVAHKEHIKNLKKSVDVLTLTATPIPRTMQMSLSGVRDLSIMDTPPENRYPILTYVGQFNKEIIRNAIRREMARGGQVYYVHNRVETIYKVARLIQELVPNTRYAIAHGQMDESSLEKVMNEFLQHKYDILICTTIIESGIDIVTVNTLIVDQAERLGLSTLYQLRGRVGRAHHQAYAYFFFSPKRTLTSAAFERLKTVGEFTQLGSGLKIALRDLEIRGAGNLLGPEQHGHMAAVGFELFCQMLSEAVQEIKGVLPEKIQVRIKLPISAYIPHDYIEDEILRTEAYQRLSSVVSLKEVDEAAKELQDRYGSLPPPVRNLIDVLRLRVLAQHKRITNLSWERKRLIIYPIDLGERELNLLRDKEQTYKFIYRRQEKILKADGLQVAEIITFLLKLFSVIIR